MAEPRPAGATVTPGRYRCEECGHEIEVPEGKVVNLPVCPACLAELWELVA
jgi:Zn finger protein HypA/HybF involved in hydrogenase expression